MADTHDDVTIVTTEKETRWRQLRPLIGVLTLLAIGHRVYAAESDVSAASNAEASAIQIVQVWTPHLFYMIMIIGIAIAFYVITRVED